MTNDTRPFNPGAAQHLDEILCGLYRRMAPVEQVLLEAAAGKRPPPDSEECRSLAMKLGVPDEYNAQAQCRWAEDEDGVWETECGRKWVFDTGGVADNGVRYCHSCGQRVVPAPYEPEPEDTA